VGGIEGMVGGIVAGSAAKGCDITGCDITGAVIGGGMIGDAGGEVIGWSALGGTLPNGGSVFSVLMVVRLYLSLCSHCASRPIRHRVSVARSLRARLVAGITSGIRLL
jgi:hypothetical protein